MSPKILLLFVIILLGCTAVPDTDIATVIPTRTPQPTSTANTPEIGPVINESELTETPWPLLTAVPTATATPFPNVGTPWPSPTAIPVAKSTASPQLITTAPIFNSSNVQVDGWSPDGRYLVYFEHENDLPPFLPVPDLRDTAPGSFNI